MALKTYILPPNLTTHPGDALKIGTIIVDPFRPLKPLSESATPLDTVTHTELETEVSNSSKYGFSSSIWAQFLEIANAKLSARVGRDIRSTYTVSSLETISLRQDPSDEYAATRTEEPKVKAAMNADLVGRRPVYMISGLKIAKGLSWSREQTQSTSGEVGTSVPITEQVTARAEVGAERETGHKFSSRTEQDVVFAYQLHVIADKGWRRRRIVADQYVPKGGLLGKDDEKEGEEGVDAAPAAGEELIDVAEENEDEIVRMEFEDGREKVLCIYLESDGS